MNSIRIFFFLVWLTTSLHATAQSNVPDAIVRVQPHYPEQALLDKTEGWVKMKFTITTNGSVENVEVAAAEPSGVFDQAAVQAMQKFKFKPTMENNQPVSKVATLTMAFELPDMLKAETTANQPIWQSGPMNYLVESSRKYQQYTNRLVVSQANSGAIVRVMPLPGSYGHQGVLTTHPESPYLFYHHNVNKKKGNIVIYNKQDLSMVRTISVSQLNVLLFEQRYYRYFEMSDDGDTLMAYVGSTRKPELLLIDAMTGNTIKTLKMSTNTLIRSDQDNAYIWTRRINPEGANTARINKLNKVELNIYDTSDNLRQIRSIKITEKLWSVNYWRDTLFMVFEYEKQEPAYRLMALDLLKNDYPVDFPSNRKPVATTLSADQESLILAGQTPGSDRHLQLLELKNGVVKDWSQTGLNPDFNAIKPLIINDQVHVDIYARRSFTRLNLEQPEKPIQVEIPINAADGIYNSDFSKVWITEMVGPTVAMVDVAQSQYIDKQNTGDPQKKFGQIMQSILVSAITAPTGVMVTPVIGAIRSSNELFLNGKQTRLFAINLKTSDVTTFNANDLSDKHYVDTGKNTYQLYQGSHLPDLPVVAIAEKQVTFMDPDTGRQTATIEFDQAIRINEAHFLIYRKNDEIHQISLHQIPEFTDE
ncbi:MAG: energy transducer TonB [Xanthomonadales bacterium]|nr:energy transducer TonB [Xanthomonadales bacterium]